MNSALQIIMSNDIITSYIQADYCVDKLETPIKIGQINSEVESLLNETETDSWCFITAWNPLSEELPWQENLERNNWLKKDLADYIILEGEGRDPKGEWQPERSFLVLGISKQDAKAFAVKHRQRAIVFGRKGKPAELLETLGFPLAECQEDV